MRIDSGLSTDLYKAIRDSITRVAADKAGVLFKPDHLDEMARRASQRVIALLDAVEGEQCLLCGACPICGKREDHVH